MCVLYRYIMCTYLNLGYFLRSNSWPEKMTGFFFFIVFSNIERVTVSQSRRLIIGRRLINEDIVINVFLYTHVHKKTYNKVRRWRAKKKKIKNR